MVKVKSNLEDVSLSVNGEPSGKLGPDWRVLELEQGTHRLIADKQYFQAQEKVIQIRANEVAPSIIFNFQAAEGFKIEKSQTGVAGQGRGDLTVITDIPGARLTLNGTPVSGEVTPLTVRELGEGEWHIKVEVLGKTLEKNVLIQPDELVVARFFFDEAKQREHEQEAKQDVIRKARVSVVESELTASNAELKKLNQHVRSTRSEVEKTIAQMKKANEFKENLSFPSNRINYESATLPSPVKVQLMEKNILMPDQTKKKLSVQVYGSKFSLSDTKSGFIPGSPIKVNGQNAEKSTFSLLYDSKEVASFARERRHSYSGKSSVFGRNDSYSVQGSDAYQRVFQLYPIRVAVKFDEKRTEMKIEATLMDEASEGVVAYSGLKNLQLQVQQLEARIKSLHEEKSKLVVK